MPNIKLPGKQPGEDVIELNGVHSLVIIGANGSGKSRMGAWIEKDSGSSAHRIGAQRALSIPSDISPLSLEAAESRWLYGHYEPSFTKERNQNWRAERRWHNDETGSLLNDFNSLLAVLFANEAKCSVEYRRAAQKQKPENRPENCTIDNLKEIWAAILPHRNLRFSDYKVEAAAQNGIFYHGKEMSDGERVVIYLLGQVLSAPRNSVLIIDEPEIHVHAAVQAPLWDALEASRQDCSFIYITHDLRFAATRTRSRKIWMKSYQGENRWDWDFMPEGADIPEELLLELLGSRRPVIFVEGEKDSFDAAIYQALYPKHLIVPRQSGAKVVEATKALQSLDQLHHLEPKGFIDRDRKEQEEIDALRAAGIRVIGVAEIENLLCIPEAIEAVAQRLMKEDVAACVANAKTSVFRSFAENLEQQALECAINRIQFRLSGFSPASKRVPVGDIQTELQGYLAQINLADETQEIRETFKAIADHQDYMGALRVYNCKGIPSFVATAIGGINRDEYCRLVIQIVKDDPSGSVGSAMRKIIEDS